MPEVPLQFAKQDKGFVLYKKYRFHVRAIYTLLELFPFVNKILLSKFGRELALARLDNRAGILHRSSLLTDQILYALAKRKIPVVSPPVLSFEHNFNNPVIAPWSKYYDMKNIIVMFIDENGESILERKVKVMSEGDFIKTRHFLKRILLLNKERILLLDKERIKKRKSQSLKSNDVSGNANLAEGRKIEYMQIKYKPSMSALKVAEKVIGKMGEYYALSVRRGDIGKDRFLADDLVQDVVQCNVPKGARLYVMSNEGDVTHFDFLREDYKVYQYFDFSELAKIVQGNDADNYMLFTIERLLFTSAKVGVYPNLGNGRLTDRGRYLSFSFRRSINDIRLFLNQNVWV